MSRGRSAGWAGATRDDRRFELLWVWKQGGDVEEVDELDRAQRPVDDPEEEIRRRGLPFKRGRLDERKAMERPMTPHGASPGSGDDQVDRGTAIPPVGSGDQRCLTPEGNDARIIGRQQEVED